MSNFASTRLREVGSPEWCARLLRSTVRDTLTLITDSLQTAGDLPAATPRTELHEFVSTHEHGDLLKGVVLQSKIDMERSIRGVADLLEGIITLLESGGKSVVSTMALARSAGESVLRFCHIHDPNETPSRTLTRMAAYQLESVEDNLHTAEAFGEHGTDDAAEVRESIAAVHLQLEGSGFKRLPGKRPERTINITFLGETENVNFNVTAAFKKYLVVGYWNWALGSGATHGRGWFLPHIIGTFDEPPLMGRDEVAVTVTLQILELADSFAVALGGHTGSDIDEYQRKIHQRRVGVLAASSEQIVQPISHREYGNNVPPKMS
jgi:hypothetical protein